MDGASAVERTDAARKWILTENRKQNMKIEKQMVGLCAVLSALSLTAGTNTWDNAKAPGGNTPITAYDWSDPENWKDASYVPGTWGDGAILGNASPAPRFFRLPELMRVTRIEYGPGNYLLGDFYFGDSADAKFGARTSINGDTVIFGDFYTCSLALGPYIASFSIAGYFRDSNTPVGDRIPRSQGNVSMGRTGDLTMRMDLWADSPDPVRAAPFQDAGFTLANAGFTFIGPRGAEAQDSAWNLTEGSTYVKFSGDGNNGVVPGMVVTGAGLPTDGDPVFVKYVFKTTGWIELSAAATATADAAALHFAAITPSVEQYIKTESGMQSGPHRMRVVKYREQDGCRVIYRDANAYAGLLGRRWGLTPAEVGSGWIPGDIVFSNATRTATATVSVTNWMDVCRLEFPQMLTDSSRAFWAGTADCDARLTVREGDAGGIPRLVSIRGKMEKRGAGALTLGICEAESTGTLKLTEGSLTLTSVEARPLSLSALDLAAGTVLALPAEGLSVGSFSAATGAKIVGPGTLTLDLPPEASYDEGAVTLEGGAKIVVRGGIPGAQISARPVANVVGHPAFWLDASKPETITLNADGEVTRWNDCRAGEPMFCTNITRAPLYVNGEQMTNKYVKIRRRTDTLGLIANTETLAWSVPVADVRAVFMMHDAADGGGDLLGRTARLNSSYFGTQGGPFYRGSSYKWENALIYFKYGTACVTNGWFYQNGTLVNAMGTGYLGPFMQLTEFHSNTAYPANASRRELWIDAFGTSYQDGGLGAPSYYIDGENGGQRIAECIIYTNTLSYAERAQVAQYLMNKWLDKDVAYQEFDPRVTQANSGALAAANEQIEVAAGSVRFASSVSGTGSLVKTGEGLLYVYELPSGGVDVQKGELVVKSLSLDANSVPGDAWLHMDASAAETITKNAAGGVETWDDVRGNGMTLRPVWSDAAKAQVTEGALNGRAVVDLGEATSDIKGAASFRLYENGEGYIHDNSYPGFINSPQIKDMFFVAGSKRGGGSLAGGWGNGYPAQGLPHNSADPTAPILCVATESHWNMALNFLSTQFSNNTTRIQMNGARLDPFTTPFSGGYDAFSFNNVNQKTDTFGVYGQTGNFVGGLEYGEILLYTNRLSDAEIAQVEAYLQKRWFNRDTEGYLVAEASSFVVAAGAQATIRDGALETAALGGAGTISGKLLLREGGTFLVDVPASGRPEGPLTVAGEVTLSETATVAFTGTPERIEPGVYPLLTATSIVGSVADWTVPKPTAGLGARIALENGQLVLHVFGAGTMLILR